MSVQFSISIEQPNIEKDELFLRFWINDQYVEFPLSKKFNIDDYNQKIMDIENMLADDYESSLNADLTNNDLSDKILLN